MRIIIILFLFLSSAFLPIASTNAIEFEDGEDYSRVFKENAGIGNTTLVEYIEIIISAFLSLLGIIFLILIIMAGYKWFTAGGNEANVKTATESITRAIIGLLIILSAYAITYFVFRNLPFEKTRTQQTGARQTDRLPNN